MLTNELRVIGTRVPRIDGTTKASGDARYAVDVTLPRMLHARILRSPHPHARIVKLDLSRAQKLRGVKAAITVEDTPKIPYSLMAPAFADRMPLAFGKVRYIGDEVAAVAAVDEETAEEALDLIEVEYEELPGVFDPEAAMQAGAPLIHEGRERNIVFQWQWAEGDVEQGFRAAREVVEGRFRVEAQAHCCMETHACVAQFDPDGRLTLWTSTQSPYYVRKDVARVLQLPIEKVRVMKVAVGGGFGSKSRIHEEAICALLARRAGRPVRLVLTREEEFVATRLRHPMVVTLKVGARADGALAAVEGRSLVDAGAYHDTASRVCSTMFQEDLIFTYRMPCVRLQGLAVHTNNPPGGRMRGFAGPAVVFALESQMDLLAHRLGIDPVELRLRNAYRTGDALNEGKAMGPTGLVECIERAAAAVDWATRRRGSSQGRDLGREHVGDGSRRVRRGIGIACMNYGCSGQRGDVGNALVTVHDNGRVIVHSGGTEIGGGQETVMAQIAAEVLGVPYERVDVVAMQTDATPVDFGSRSSRFTFMGGNAVRLAAEDARAQLLGLAAEILEANREDLELRDGQIHVRGSPERAVAVVDLVMKAGRPRVAKGEVVEMVTRPVVGRGQFDRDRELDSHLVVKAFAAQVAEVEVDLDTGQVRVVGLVAAHDVGRAIFLTGVEGQIEGGSFQGLGYGLTEGLIFEQGRTLNGNFMTYLMATSVDMPPVRSLIVETPHPHPNGPFGAKGVAEPACIPTAAAIANAIFHATGVQVRELPLTPERVARALRQG
ncbi:MAG: xanthine dehydrogenase family protein molybdopterin-binding subunit [Deltaproteobacteria bacterium]|nr:xanthine dehydrogenase family protein molybdopterin-binding subunit [Deltaproteobacteria bacterium]